MATDAQRKRSRTIIADSMACKTIGKCVKETAREWQKLVRLGNADANGTCKCVTCGKEHHYKAMHAGHFLSRRFASTVFEPMNCHPQCNHCNTYCGGAADKYREFMQQTYGDIAIQYLEDLSRTVRQWTRAELVEMKLEFREEIRALEKGLNG